MKLRFGTAVFVSLISTTAALADPLVALRATLARFPGTTDLRAGLETQVTREKNSDKTPKVESGRVQVDLEQSGGALRVSYPPALLESARREARAERVDPEKTSPTLSAMRAIVVTDLADSLNFADALLRQLEGARLIDIKDVSLQGKPSKLLQIAIDPRLSKEDKKHVKSAASTLRLWIAADGIPLAADRTTRIKASFLLIKFENLSRESWSFTQRGDHLVAVQHQEENEGAGFGESFKDKTVEKITLREQVAKN